MNITEIHFGGQFIRLTFGFPHPAGSSATVQIARTATLRAASAPGWVDALYGNAKGTYLEMIGRESES